MFEDVQTASTYAFSSPYRFNGKELDPETGLTYYGARYYQNKLNLWLSVDPLAMNENNRYLTPYHFVVNNPILNFDPKGEDWFENSETGQLMWLKDDVDVYENDNGTWNNIGTELLDFDGENLTYYTQGTNDDGEMFLKVNRYKARSGKMKDDETFDYSEKAQAQPSKGPLPEGTYSINPQRIQWWEDESFMQKSAAAIGKGTWPGGQISWGPARAWINPGEVLINDPGTGQSVTRGGFTIHGGYEFGSSGCIDLGQNARDFFEQLESSGSNNIRLRVSFKSSNIPL